MIIIGNISRYALGLAICSDASPTDGMLDLFIMPCDNRWRLLAWTTFVAARLHKYLPQAIYVRARKINIDAVGKIKIPVEVDGDPAGLLPAQMEVVPRAASLLCFRSERTKLLHRRDNGTQ